MLPRIEASFGYSVIFSISFLQMEFGHAMGKVH